MSQSLEKRSIVHKIKAIIKSLIIAFFFTTFIILVIGITFGPVINKGLSILSTLSLELGYGSNDNVKFDPVKKKLAVKPSWGAQFGQLVIPSISVDIPIYHGDDTPQLATGAGHSPGTKFPGEGGTVLLAAHNSHGLFYTLPQIKIGDKVSVKTIYGDFNYEVYKTDIVDFRDKDAVEIQNDEEILAMYTCYPVDNVWYVNDRFIVYAKLVGDSDD